MKRGKFLSRAKIFGMASLAAALVGCAHLSYKPGKELRKLDPVIEQRYNEPYTFRSLSEKLMGSNPRYSIKELNIVYSGNNYVSNPINNVRMILYEQREKGPLILIFPINGGNYFVENFFASYLSDRGYNCAIVRRKTDDFLEGMADSKDLCKIDEMLWYDVYSGKIATDWVSSRNSVDKKKIGVFGISRGGITAASFSSLERRVSASIIAMASGDLYDLISKIPEEGIRRRVDRVKRTNKLTDEQLRLLLKEVISLDPINVAGSLDSSKVLFVSTLFDKIIPFEAQYKLRRVIGNPEAITLPFGHYWAAAALPFMVNDAYHFYGRKFLALDKKDEIKNFGFLFSKKK